MESEPPPRPLVVTHLMRPPEEEEEKDRAGRREGQGLKRRRGPHYRQSHATKEQPGIQDNRIAVWLPHTGNLVVHLSVVKLGWVEYPVVHATLARGVYGVVQNQSSSYSRVEVYFKDPWPLA